MIKKIILASKSKIRKKILEEVGNLLTDDFLYKKMSMLHNPYGDGMSSNRICTILEEVAL